METVELKKDKVYLKLKQSIVTGKLPAGKKLPRETDFAKSLNVGRITLRSSLDRLEYEGYIKRIHGKGTFVTPDNINSAVKTIMVLNGSDAGFESPHNYIVPEIVRIAESKDFKTFVTTSTALMMFSSVDIKNFVKENNVIGITAVMNHFHGDEAILDKFRNAGVPTIITHAGLEDSEVTGFASIAINEKEGWEAAIAYLAECGHQHIGMLGGPTDNRFRGYNEQECMNLLDKHGAEPVESIIIRTEFDREQIKNAVRGMFDGVKKPTAILCFSDFYAIYVYEALKEMGLKIPEDVAVMGTCGYPDARLLSPPLSTVDYEYSKFAEMAVEMLNEPEKWFSNGKGKLRLKPFKLRKRKSTKIKK
jgi:DNA-binding LacI/PurR family transcriptional regulator